MMTLQEILALPGDAAMAHLKYRKTPHPDTEGLYADWNPERHDVHDTRKRPKAKVLVKEPHIDPAGNRRPAEYTHEEVNRISLPIEQDIVNIHTAFTVGTEPLLDCDAGNDREGELLEIIGYINKKNKLKYQNKKVVRSLLSEQEVAEYWYMADDKSGFWDKVWAKLKTLSGIRSKPEKKLRSVLWSPFRGDKLYPLFDDFGDLIALSREYKTKDIKGVEHLNFMCVTDTEVVTWKEENNWQKEVFKHGFKKMPVVYAYRSEALCKNIKTMRNRLELLLSDYADCIDRYFFPFMLLKGDINGVPKKAGKSKMLKIEGADADARYLEWSQSPESVKLELGTLTEQIYSMTNTPRISFENMKGTNARSGVAFKYTFMGVHLAVENHAEIVGEFLQRRYNFLASAIGSISPALEQASQSIDINIEIVPYMIDSLADKVRIATEGTGGGVMSKREGIAFVGIADNVNDSLKEIQQEKKEEGRFGLNE